MMVKDNIEKNFKKYKDYTDKFIKELGLNSWEIFITMSNKDDGARSIAAMCSRIGRQMEIKPDKRWLKSNPSDKELEIVAYHEVLEVLLLRIRGMLMVEFSEERVDEEIHTVIRTLENAKFGFESREP